jgi:hypothetical protein
MKNADDLAKKMGPKLKNDLEAKGFVIDTIIVVSALVSIIVNLVKLSKTCKYTPEQALEHIRRPNLLDKIKIRKVIRSSLKDQKVKIPRGVGGDPAIVAIEQAVSEAAGAINKKDIQAILEATEE